METMSREASDRDQPPAGTFQFSVAQLVMLTVAIAIVCVAYRSLGLMAAMRTGYIAVLVAAFNAGLRGTARDVMWLILLLCWVPR